MTKSTYDQPRPTLSADLRRAVEVESGHACAVARCGEHTYLEVHHINQNREDNRLRNLVLLCDKHHKMAHANVIDRKALEQYKEALQREHDTELAGRIAKLEALLAVQPKIATEPTSSASQTNQLVDEGLPTLTFGSRAGLAARTLEQLALARFETERGLYLQRQADLVSGGSRLQLDALYRSPEADRDLLVEVRWIRKRYLDAPVWVQQVVAATEAYELFTGRKAKGVLILVTPNRPWANVGELQETSGELARASHPPEVVVYNYDQLGFVPAAVSVDTLGPLLPRGGFSGGQDG
jgi:hypothetical protein